MKSFYALSVTFIMSFAMYAQTHQCTLMSPTCCSEEDEYFEMQPTDETAPRPSGTVIYANQVPIVHFDGIVNRYPLEIRIESDQEVVSASIDYYDFETFSYLVGDLVDDGTGLDKEPGDDTYTSLTPIVQSRNIRNDDILYHYNLISGTVTLTYANGSTEAFKAKLDGYTIVGEEIILDTNNLEINNIGSFYYTQNAVNYVLPQEYSRNQINFPFSTVRQDFKNIWTDFNDSYLVFTASSETNGETINFQTSVSPPGKYIINLSNRGMSTAFPLNHEINHFWLYSTEFNFFSSHLRYVQRPQSGFGYDCYNGVMTNIFEENDAVKYEIDEADNPHEYFYNDLELNLMGALPLDSVDFPIKYFDRATFNSSDCNRTLNTLSDGSIKYLSKEDYVGFVASIDDLEDVSDGLDLKFIFLTEEPLSKLEHAFLEYLVLHYANIFKASASDMVHLNTEIYKILSSVNNASQDEDAFSVYPNPTYGFITIDLASDTEAMLTIYDMTGRVHKMDLIQKGRIDYDVNDLPAGIYLMKIVNSEGRHWTNRIVKY